ncbi:PLAC8 motif-containing protein [Trema orientale]|uniref:PLAC8 motif-containing protein n=1 Tax=Trema orientale TaxID=63057 RepID=A0A2P5ENB7_TREOI|nr:PLAC8 motif-containing protein [Trema orientale]
MDPNSTKPPAHGQWTTGLYDCFEDRSNCCFTCFCPCVVFGRIAEIADKGTISSNKACLLYSALGAIHWASLFGATYRTKLRALFSLPEEPHSDCFLHSCCCVCSLTQEYRELQNRGFDPAIGWEANVEKWKREGLEPPITEQRMNR